VVRRKGSAWKSTPLLERYGEAAPGTAGSLLQASFSLNGREFICTDSPVKHQFTFMRSLSFLVDCASEAKIDRRSRPCPQVGAL
jgi:predicted 3-demethylubiquinone-9 3-methyltransferase (glyoxalase superfamily)